MKRRNLSWTKPRIVSLSQLPETLGHCTVGTTGSPSESGPLGFVCHFGDYTGNSASHTCQSGGTANGGCVEGTSAGYHQGNGGCQMGGVVHH